MVPDRNCLRYNWGRHVRTASLGGKIMTFDCPSVGAKTDCALCPAEIKRRCIPPAIDAEKANEALAMVAQLRGRTA